MEDPETTEFLKKNTELHELKLQLREITAYVDTLISQAKEMEAETGKARGERDAALLQNKEMTKYRDEWKRVGDIRLEQLEAAERLNGELRKALEEIGRVDPAHVPNVALRMAIIAREALVVNDRERRIVPLPHTAARPERSEALAVEGQWGKRKCEWCGGTDSHASMCRNFSQ